MFPVCGKIVIKELIIFFINYIYVNKAKYLIQMKHNPIAVKILSVFFSNYKLFITINPTNI
jgi:hypothetical protein